MERSFRKEPGRYRPDPKGVKIFAGICLRVILLVAAQSPKLGIRLGALRQSRESPRGGYPGLAF